MVRPIKSRKIDFLPHTRYFIPMNNRPGDIAKDEEDPMLIRLEELEAMRLRDIEDLSQQECADIMGISRQTFQNIVANGRRNITIALTQGKPIRIWGGNYSFRFCRFKCKSCNRTYEIEYIKDRDICPLCNSQNIVCRAKDARCKDWCRQ